jgi:hypothetical protein
MSMRCKQCAESFPKNQPYDLFELRRHRYLPADPQNTTHSGFLEDGGTFCSRKCLSDYLKASDRSGTIDLGSRRDKLGL